MFLEHLLNNNDGQTTNTARTFVASLGTLQNKFECAFEATEDFGGKQAAFLDIYPTGSDLAKDHKKFGGIFVRIWIFGEPKMITTGIFLGAERAEQSEPRRGVAVTRQKLGAALNGFESLEGFSYHTWSSGNFPWTSKSSRAVARQLEQFISFRQDAVVGGQVAAIEEKVGKAIKFLDENLFKLKPIPEFGKTIIHEYYSENLPEQALAVIDSSSLASLIGEFGSILNSEEVKIHASKNAISRFVSSLISKRFIVACGLAGSGKTKIAQAFARWITPKTANSGEANPYYSLIPVGADWTGNENIVGYPNGLDPKNYVTKPALELILHAQAHQEIPHFLILDEMNLSHVERYFADLLSAIESGEEIPLYEGDTRTSDGTEIPRMLRLPDNLFIVGTVNVDETTYLFSPKVLDRANVIEFRMEPDELARFLVSPKKPNLDDLDGKGAAYAKDFVAATADKSREVPAAVKADYGQEMLLFFKLLREHNAEFGYRTGYESARFVHFYKLLGGFADTDANWFNGAMDCVIVQKFLPKLHGSRSKMEGLLWALAWVCGAKREGKPPEDFIKECLEAGKALDEGKFSPEKVLADLGGGKARYPLSFDKVIRMYQKLKRDQFVSFAEA